MSKYFDDEEKVLLSSYLKKIEPENDIFAEKKKSSTKFLINCLGDVELSESVIKTLTSYINTYGGKYNVRTKPKTLKGIYEVYSKIPRLTGEAIEEISRSYISDLYEEYSLVSIFEDLIKTNGENDETFIKYMDSVEKASEELQERYDKDASVLDKFKEEYFKYVGAKHYVNITSYLKEAVKREHISIDAILSSLPSPELVEKDAEQLAELAKENRIIFGIGIPVSYKMTKELAENGDLSSFEEQPYYYISTTDKCVDTTFTKQEFLDSVKKEYQKRIN